MELTHHPLAIPEIGSNHRVEFFAGAAKRRVPVL
jgi:hypothetical protein